MLSRFVIGFLLRSKQLPSTMIFRAPKKICHCFHFFSIYFLWSGGIRWHDLNVFNVELQASFSLSSFIHMKRLCSFSLLSAIRVVSSAYLRLLIFLPAILIPPCDSSRLTFCMMYSASSLVVPRVKRLPATWETRVQSLGQEDPLQKEMATHCGTLAWKIPSMGKPVGHSLW